MRGYKTELWPMLRRSVTTGSMSWMNLIWASMRGALLYEAGAAGWREVEMNVRLAERRSSRLIGARRPGLAG
jgi:hypothetical protein